MSQLMAPTTRNKKRAIEQDDVGKKTAKPASEQDFFNDSFDDHVSQNPEILTQPPLGRVVRQVEVIDSDNEGGYFMGSGSVAEGCVEYLDWKPPEAIERNHNKTFWK